MVRLDKATHTRLRVVSAQIGTPVSILIREAVAGILAKHGVKVEAAKPEQAQQ
ncbi:hypothetical protein LMG28138_01619 [Pararobbsia alpina]|uniref:Predicted DNA-binding protein ribbon-helix-helix domain-containing protein n=2 Tax=Pararobbsia alpina TaxID=621374 RepID=A0A6S7B2G8_9BURK|nr:hypothetical protein LMG28138_01619 [Pararobbsia alpina]